ncbi:MAG TPA: SRPBCC family protein [Gemmatimonadales bacterium]|nr:SRPBCC family protein [Gemmatimonadales bacterium]
MAEIRARAQAEIPAPPGMVYDVLADYQRGHQDILPPQYFQNFKVEEGGIGAGTRISFEVKSFGTTRRFEMRVSEPEPGHILVETDIATGTATTFKVERGPRGQGSLVSISTRYRKGGITGWLEGLMAPRMLRQIYSEELKLLAKRCR